MAAPTTAEIRDQITRYAALLEQQGNTGLANEVRGLLGGQMPTTPQGKHAANVLLAGTSFEGNPRLLHQTLLAESAAASGRNTPDDYGGRPTYPAAAQAAPTPTGLPATGTGGAPPTFGGGAVQGANAVGAVPVVPATPPPAFVPTGDRGYSPRNDGTIPIPGQGAGGVPYQAQKTGPGTVPTADTITPGGKGFLSEVERGYAAGNQGNAIAAIRREKTGGQRDRSIGGKYREGMLGNALRAFLAMQMPSGVDPKTGAPMFTGNPVTQASQGLADIVAGSTNGQGFGGVLRGQAAGLMGQDFSQFDDEQILPMLAAAQSAGSFGYGDFAGYAGENRLADLENQSQQAFLGGNTTGVLNQPGALDAFLGLLQQYLAPR